MLFFLQSSAFSRLFLAFSQLLTSSDVLPDIVKTVSLFTKSFAHTFTLGPNPFNVKADNATSRESSKDGLPHMKYAEK